MLKKEQKRAFVSMTFGTGNTNQLKQKSEVTASWGRAVGSTGKNRRESAERINMFLP